jgi:hypothetical protein
MDFGTDILCEGDLDPGFGLVTSFALLGQDLLHRFQTDEGSLWYDTSYGYNLLVLLGEKVDAAMLFRAATRVAHEAEKDERVLRASAVVTYNAGTFTVTVSVTTADGPFTYVLQVDKLGVVLASAP